jgi:cytoskeletal protein RodZ
MDDQHTSSAAPGGATPLTPDQIKNVTGGVVPSPAQPAAFDKAREQASLSAEAAAAAAKAKASGSK